MPFVLQIISQQYGVTRMTGKWWHDNHHMGTGCIVNKLIRFCQIGVKIKLKLIMHDFQLRRNCIRGPVSLSVLSVCVFVTHLWSDMPLELLLDFLCLLYLDGLNGKYPVESRPRWPGDCFWFMKIIFLAVLNTRLARWTFQKFYICCFVTYSC